MAEKRKRRGLFPLILGAILLAAGLFGAHGEEALIQYAVRAPQAVEVDEADAGSRSPNDPALDLIGGLDTVWEEMEGAISQKAVHASAFAFSLASDKGESAQAALHAVDESYFAVYQKLLLYGRMIYPEEFLRGDRVMVLDEDLAVKLFMISDPTDRYVTVGGQEYRIVGVIRHTRSVGEADLFGAYVPLESIREETMDMDMLTVTVRPVAQSGTLAAFTAAMERWSSGGSVYDLEKEAMRAGMLGRLILCAAALYLLLAAIRCLNRLTIGRVSAFRRDMRIEYARVLAPAFSRDMLLMIIGYAAALGALAGLTVWLIQPVYTFTEWVPAVLVEWEDIRTTFWNLTAEAANPVRCMTAEMIRIEFWARIARWGLIAALFGAAVMLTGSRSTEQ